MAIGHAHRAYGTQIVAQGDSEKLRYSGSVLYGVELPVVPSESVEPEYAGAWSIGNTRNRESVEVHPIQAVRIVGHQYHALLGNEGHTLR